MGMELRESRLWTHRGARTRDLRSSSPINIQYSTHYLLPGISNFFCTLDKWAR